MRRYATTTLLLLAAVTLILGIPHTAEAQYGGSSTRSIYQATRGYLYNRPTVSPYLNLTSRDAQYGLPNYFTQVRPRVEQQQQELASQRQTAQMQQQLNQVQDQVRASQQQATGMMLTGRVGWSARGMPRFGTYMSYYPGFQRIGR